MLCMLGTQTAAAAADCCVSCLWCPQHSSAVLTRSMLLLTTHTPQVLQLLLRLLLCCHLSCQHCLLLLQLSKLQPHRLRALGSSGVPAGQNEQYSRYSNEMKGLPMSSFLGVRLLQGCDTYGSKHMRAWQQVAAALSAAVLLPVRC